MDTKQADQDDPPASEATQKQPGCQHHWVIDPPKGPVTRFLEIAPGCYYLLGAATEEHGIQGHHQGRFAIDDRSLALGLELSLRVIDEYLGE